MFKMKMKKVENFPENSRNLIKVIIHPHLMIKPLLAS